VPTENEEYYGTWINEEYDGTLTWAKWVINPDGTWASFAETTSMENPKGAGLYILAVKWTDANGDVWYKMSWKNELLEKSGYGLIHISYSGSTMEVAYDPSDYPTKIDNTKSWRRNGGIHH
jgi:hypothetical protein